MKKFLSLMAALGLIWVAGASAETPANYTLTINGETHDVGLGRETVVTLKSGMELIVKLDMKDQVLYEDEFVSFAHGSGESVSQADVAAGIRQIMISQAKGTVLLIQEYSTMDPSILLKQMLNEVTKEDRSFGYKMVEETISNKLTDGKVLEGVRATLTYQNETKYLTLSVYGKSDRGVLILTMIDKEYIPTDGHMLDLMWETLKIKF